MLIEELELTLANVDLGTLTEHSAMVLFGIVASHAMTEGTGRSTREIQDMSGTTLYPALYHSHLQVPSTHLLQGFQVWDRVGVGIDMRSFGGMFLESTSLLGRKEEIPADVSTWGSVQLPRLRSNNLFILEDRRGESSPSAPRAGHVAKLPKLTAPPEAAARFSEVQVTGGKLDAFGGNLQLRSPLIYPLLTGRDLTPGHAMMFATFTKVMDWAERTLLLQHVWPGCPHVVVDSRAVLERETFYLGNAFADHTLQIDIRAKLLPCPADLAVPSVTLVPAAILEFATEIYNQSRNSLLIVSRGKQLIALPREQKTACREVERLLKHHGSTK